MTKRKIYEKCIELIQSDKVRFICHALDSVAIYVSCEKQKKLILKLKYQFLDAENIPQEFRGEKWRGDPLVGFWYPDAHKERIDYLKHLISKL